MSHNCTTVLQCNNALYGVFCNAFVLTNNFNSQSGALCHHSVCDNLPKGALCVSEKLFSWTNVPLCSLDREKYPFCVQIWPSKISLPVNVCYKARTGWQIHTTMAPMLFCGTAAICVTLAPAEYQRCKYNTDTKVSYCTDRASSLFFFLSKQRCLPVQHTSRVMFWSLWRYV